jgi:ubiquinol-cytochrome c reductase cytochrome b subunit
MKSPLIKTVTSWVDQRTGLVSFFTDFLHEEIVGGTRFSYTLGSACMFLLTLQIVTGIWQLFYYVPTIDYAYSSLNYLRLQVPYGWLIHGIHYWGGTLFTIIVGLHALRVFVWGSYKKPREVVWLVGILLILITALFMFTGPVLPWDKNGYWAGQVGIGIAGSVPLVGSFTQSILQGANKMGQMALLRMYVLHVAILPAAICGFVMLHLIAFRVAGESGPWDEKKRKGVGYFWPEQIFKDVVVSLLIFLLLVFLSAFFPAPFSGLADPMDTLITPKPAWNFLFLYQLLKFLPGPLEPLGTAGVPLMIVLLFGSLPFLDKSPEKNPFKRGFVVLTGFVFVGVILFLTYLGFIYRSPAELAQMDKPGEVAAAVTNNKIPMDLEKSISLANDKKLTGEQLFKTLGCTECHTTTGKASNKQGPDLSHEVANGRAHQWLHDQIVAPQSHNQRTIMPPYSHLSNGNVENLVNYIESLKPAEAPAPTPPPPAAAGGAVDNTALIKYGEQLFNSQGCVQCHTIQGRPSNKPGPDLIMAIKKDMPTKDWLKTQLMTPQAHNPLSIMPSFATRLNDDQMNAMIVFLSSLSTRSATPAAAGEQEEAPEDKSTSESGPATGIQSAGIIGDKEHGAILFHQSCIMCHGPHGNNKTSVYSGYLTDKNQSNGTTAPKGVPSLNPIDHDVFNSDPQTFVEIIDQRLQHGVPNSQGGPNMPNFGDSHALTQAQIADLEAYVLSINGVDRTQISNPGIEPKEFFFMLVGILSALILLAALFWYLMKLIKV